MCVQLTGKVERNNRFPDGRKAGESRVQRNGKLWVELVREVLKFMKKRSQMGTQPLYFHMSRLRKTLLFVLVLSGLALPSTSLGLNADEVLVIANGNYPHSVELARYYMEKRNIPADNILILSLSKSERCSRQEYEKKVALPIRNYLKKKDPYGLLIRCLVTVYGVPLAVLPPEPSAGERAELLKLQGMQRALTFKIRNSKESDDKARKALREELERTEKRIQALSRSDAGASLDSELALVVNEEYPLEGRLPNPLFLGFRGGQIEHMPERVLMVSRLDGPSAKIVRRIIDDSVKVEKEGLRGTAYFDARWPDPGDKEVKSYAFYDKSIHRIARRIMQSGAHACCPGRDKSAFPARRVQRCCSLLRLVQPGALYRLI